MNYNPSPSATNLIKRFKEKHNIITEEDKDCYFKRLSWMCYVSPLTHKIGVGSSELEAIRDWCKQNNILCEV